MKALPCRFLFPLLLLISGVANAAIWYVTPAGAGTGTGSSWANAANATKLATIISGGASGDQVWVVGSTAGTIYLPTTSTTTRTTAFVLKSGVSVYGGFAGTETALGQQNPARNITILSGNISGAVGGESYNVVVSSGNTGTTVLNGFTIEDGNANGNNQNAEGGGIYNSGTTVTYSHCIITNNTTTGIGGGVYINNTGTVTFDTCTFTANSTTASFSTQNGGGAVYCAGGTAIFLDCTFSNNTSTSEGGGMYSTGTTATLTNCTFTHNSTSNDGGGLYIYNSGTYLFTQCAFDTCTATGNGGGVALNSVSNVPFHYCSFTGNSSRATTADFGGGGFYANSGGNDTIANCTFMFNSASSYGGGFESNGMNGFVMRYTTFSQNNAAVYGGGFGISSGNTFLVANCHFSNNAAPAGGGMYMAGGQPTLSYDTLSNNTATASSGIGGGGLCEDPGGSNPTVSHCWFSGNVTNGSNGAAIYDNSSQTDSNTVFQANIAEGTGSDGGAIYHNSQTGNIINCVFVNNSATGYGGGYYNNATNETMENCTFYANSAATAGAGIYDPAGSNPSYYGNVVWGNTPDGFAVGTGNTGGIKVKYNDFQAAVPFTGGSVTGNISTNPLFVNTGSLTGADGKWATTDDGLHLQNTSPAADYQQSNYPSDDIADVGRPYVGNTYANIGAYESPFTVLALTLVDFTAVVAGAHSVDLQWDISEVNQVTEFQVQRSADGTNFVTIGTVDALSGQTNYSYADGGAIGNVLYYRLQITDLGGGMQYSPVVVVSQIPSASSALLSVWPSASTQATRTVYISSVGPATVGVILADGAGKVIWGTKTALVQGSNYLSLDLGGFPAGVYYLVVVRQDGLRGAVVVEKL
jgi:predicted outer membrane repeat protein